MLLFLVVGCVCVSHGVERMLESEREKEGSCLFMSHLYYRDGICRDCRTNIPKNKENTTEQRWRYPNIMSEKGDPLTHYFIQTTREVGPYKSCLVNSSGNELNDAAFFFFALPLNARETNEGNTKRPRQKNGGKESGGGGGPWLFVNTTN